MNNKNYHTFRTVKNYHTFRTKFKGKNHVERGEIDTTKIYKIIYKEFVDTKEKIILYTFHG